MSKKKDSLKPWLSRPAINRSVTLPLTRPLTQRLSNLNEFHPNELDPYLLFDARDSMIGTLENPTLDLDPSKPDTLNVITATRAGTATYTDSSGIIQVASPDTVRVDHVDGVPMILVEPSATNSFLYSQPTSALAFGNSATKTFNDSIAPNGEIEAFRITHNGASGSVNFSATSSITFGSDSMVLSVWAKAGSGGNNYFTWSFQNLGGAVVRAGFKLEGDGETQLITSGNGGHTLQIETYPDGWYRCIIIGNTQSSGTTTQFLYTVSGYNESSSIAGGSVLLWGFQVEAGSVATSYIPTSGSTVTRAADSLVISGSDFSDFFSGSAGTFFIQAQNRTPELNGAVLMAQNSNRMFFYKSNPNRLSTYDGGTFTHHDGLVANQLFNAAVTFNTSNRSSSLDGSALDTDTINTQWAGADILKIGFGYSNNFNGHYRRILYWPYHSDSL